MNKRITLALNNMNTDQNSIVIYGSKIERQVDQFLMENLESMRNFKTEIQHISKTSGDECCSWTYIPRLDPIVGFIIVVLISIYIQYKQSRR